MKKQAKEEKKKENKKGKKKNIFLRVVLILLLIILIAGIIFGYRIYKRYNEEGWSGVSKELLGHDEDTVNKLNKMYCLLLGESQNLTDTIMLASYDPKTQEAALLSIPRDTFIGDSMSYATGYDKINAVYETYGAESLLEDVRNLTGINVQYYLTVDTEALRVLVDKIGGVYFDVPIDMHYTDRKQGLYIDLKAGYQLLDGNKAEQVVRFRHNSDGSTYPYEYGGEDLGRMRTQRAFLTALLEQTIEKMDVNMVFNFLDIAEQYVETNLNFDAIKDYVPYILEFNMDNLKTSTLPGMSEKTGNGVWVYLVDEEETKEKIDELFYGKIPEGQIDGNVIDGNTVDDASIADDGLTGDTKPLSVEVLNGSGSTSKLKEITSELESAGFEVTQTGNTSTTNNTTVIERKDVTQEQETRLKEILDVDRLVTGDSNSLADVTIIIGTNYVI